MKRRTDIEPHGQSMKPRHDDVLETRALELMGRAEYFGTNESGDVIDDHPARAGLLADITRHPIGPRFQRDHVHAFGGPVGHFGALSCLEVQAIERSGKVEHAVDVETDRVTRCAACCLTMSDSTQ